MIQDKFNQHETDPMTLAHLLLTYTSVDAGIMKRSALLRHRSWKEEVLLLLPFKIN